MWSRRCFGSCAVLGTMIFSLLIGLVSCKKDDPRSGFAGYIEKDLGYTLVNPPKRANVVGTVFMIQDHRDMPVLFGSDCLSGLAFDTTGVALSSQAKDRSVTTSGDAALGSEDSSKAPFAWDIKRGTASAVLVTVDQAYEVVAPLGRIQQYLLDNPPRGVCSDKLRSQSSALYITYSGLMCSGLTYSFLGKDTLSNTAKAQLKKVLVARGARISTSRDSLYLRSSEAVFVGYKAARVTMLRNGGEIKVTEPLTREALEFEFSKR